MAIVVNGNSSSSQAMQQLERTTASLGRTFERISSGLEISKAADDAEGLGVAEKMDGELAALNAAGRQASDGLSAIQTAEGAANEVANIIKRMRELAVQSASETLATEERGYVQDEFRQLSGEVERIAETTEFNGIHLTGEGGGGSESNGIQVGAAGGGESRGDGEQITVTLGGEPLPGSGGMPAMSLSNPTAAEDAVAKLTTALDRLNDYRSNFDAEQDRFATVMRDLSDRTEGLAASRPRAENADFALESAEQAKFQIVQQSGAAVLGQSNGIRQTALRLLG